MSFESSLVTRTDSVVRASNEFFSLQDFGRSPVAPMSAQQVWAPVERVHNVLPNLFGQPKRMIINFLGA